MSLYSVNVAVAGGRTDAVGEAQARLILMSAISFAVVGGLVWGRLVDRWGPRRTLNLVLGLWMVMFTLAAATGFFQLPIAVLYVVAILAGICLGGVWSADRPYMLRLTPPDRIGEFYGLYGMVGRFSAVPGPLLWAGVMHLAVSRGGLPILTGQAFAIASLLVMVIGSYIILQPVTDEVRDWSRLKAARRG
jgi:UMF1 family MFS transporter